MRFTEKFEQAGAGQANGPAQPSFVLGGQYPITANYVNQFSRLTGSVKSAAQAYSRAKRTLILSQDAINRRFNGVLARFTIWSIFIGFGAFLGLPKGRSEAKG